MFKVLHKLLGSVAAMSTSSIRLVPLSQEEDGRWKMDSVKFVRRFVAEHVDKDCCFCPYSKELHQHQSVSLSAQRKI